MIPRILAHINRAFGLDGLVHYDAEAVVGLEWWMVGKGVRE